MSYLRGNIERSRTGERLTESDTEGGARRDGAVLKLVVHEAERDDQGVEEHEDEEEQATSTLVNHPVVVLLQHGARHIRRDRLGGSRVAALEALEAAALGLVALEVGGLVAIEDDVGVLLDRGDLAV